MKTKKTILCCIAVAAAILLGLALPGDRLLFLLRQNGEHKIHVLGLDGYYVKTESAPEQPCWQYYAYHLGGEDNVLVGECFGVGASSSVFDLDDDGSPELICDCVYGGTGTMRTYVYRLNGETVERGELLPEALELPEFYDWGANAVKEYFDADAENFVVEYATKDGTRTMYCTYDDFIFTPFTEN